MKGLGRGAGVSLRVALIAVVVAGAIFPLGAAGFWIFRSSERAGEDALDVRMREGMERAVQRLGTRWVQIRGELLDLAEEAAVARALRGVGDPVTASSAEPAVRARWEILREYVATLEIRDPRDRPVLRLPETLPPDLLEPTSGGLTGGTLPVEVPLHRPGGEPGGRILARLRVIRVVPLGGGPSAAEVGSVLGAFGRSGETSFLPLPFEPALLAGDTFTLEGTTWKVLHRPLESPPLELALAAPVDPYLEVFRRSARRGIGALTVVGALAILLTMLVTGPIIRSMERVSEAAGAVARGDLDRTVPERGAREIRELAGSFNAMTGSLRETLDRLARREGLATVGEFASSLAHEVRNPLTSVRLDLQRALERVDDDRTERGLERALREVNRLDTTVSGTLQVARSGRVAREPVALREPLGAALEVAGAVFEEEDVRLVPPGVYGPEPVVSGDADALEQLFLNLLLNGARAADGQVEVTVVREGTKVAVRIVDDGPGIEPETLERIFEPFFTTRKEGTGLGLAIARQVAVAHEGDLSLRMRDDGGTVAEVRLPLRS